MRLELTAAEKKYATITYDSAEHFVGMDMAPVDALSNEITIMVATHNRRATIEQCMSNLVEHKRGAQLVFYDDGSTEFHEEFLAQFSPNRVMLEKVQGLPREAVARIRTMMVRDFLSLPEYAHCKYLYMTDSDGYHDPMWLARIHEMDRQLNGQWGGISLFLSYYHTANLRGTIQMQHGAAGLSMLLRRDNLEKVFPHFTYGSYERAWDSVFSQQFCHRNIACSDVSFVEHIGYGGFNNKKSWERVRSRNATHYLIRSRRLLIPFFEALGMTGGHSRRS